MADEAKADSGYLASISSLGLDRLNQEPLRLRSEARELEISVARLALQNYRVFIANHDCVKTLRAQSKTVNDSTTSLRTQLSTFIEKAQEFRKDAGEIMSAHHQNKHTLQQHMQILDILELPQLMDACLRNLLFDGALEIAAFANVLERRHGTRGSSTVIMGVVSEIRASMVSLRSILLKQLQSSIQLPVCLNVISSLRRMDTLVLEKSGGGIAGGVGANNQKGAEERSKHLAASLEMKLQIDFLEARTVWLEAELDGAQERLLMSRGVDMDRATIDPSRWTLDLIEKNRTLWFDIATQFLAIFSEDSKGVKTSFILSSWLLLRVQDFVALLRRCVPLIESGAALYEVLDQTMFFGSSLGRLGVDFRPLVVPIFEDAVLNMTLLRWDSAVVAFERSLKLEGDYPLYIPSLSHETSVEKDKTGDTPSTNGEGEGDLLDHPEPPHSTLLFPAVAHMMNLFLESFNDLRQCAPQSLRSRLQAEMEQNMAKIASALSDYYKRCTRPGDNDVAKLVCREIGEVALPYLCSCLAFMFGTGGNCGEEMKKAFEKSLYNSFTSQGLSLPKPKQIELQLTKKPEAEVSLTATTTGSEVKNAIPSETEEGGSSNSTSENSDSKEVKQGVAVSDDVSTSAAALSVDPQAPEDDIDDDDLEDL